MRPSTEPASPAVAYVLLALTMLFWSGNAVVARGLGDAMPPAALSFWRWLFAFLIMLPLGGRAAWRQRDLLRRHGGQVVTLAVLCVSTFNVVLYGALHLTTVINVAVVNSASPAIIALLAWLMLGERAGVAAAAGIAVSIAGVLVVVTAGDPLRLLALEANVGDALMLAGVLIWAAYSVLLRRLPPGIDPLGLFTVLTGLGTIGLVPIYGLEIALGARFEPTWPVIEALAYVAVFPSVLAVLFWNHGVKAVGPTRAGVMLNLVLVFSTALAVVFLGETVEGYHLAGAALVLAGITLTTRGAPSRRPA